jgi:hypothetical protein
MAQTVAPRNRTAEVVLRASADPEQHDLLHDLPHDLPRDLLHDRRAAVP